MQRRLQEVRKEKPDADYATIAPDFETILSALVDQRALIAFANKFGFPSVEAAGRRRNRADPGHQGPQRPVQRTGLSAIPGAAAAERFGGPADHRRRLAPAPAADPRRDQCAGVGRDGQPLCLDVARIARGRGRGGARGRVQGRPQSDRRRPPALLRRQPQPLHDPRTARPANRADRPGAGRQRHRVGPGNRRLLQQQQRDLRARRTQGASARRWWPTRRARTPSPPRSRPARRSPRPRASAAVTSLKDQTRAAYAGIAGDKMAAAVFSAPTGAVVGPIQSDFGWVVAKVDSVKDGGRQVARPGALRNRRQAQPSTSASRRSRTWSTRSRTRSTKAIISPKPRPPPKSR